MIGEERAREVARGAVNRVAGPGAVDLLRPDSPLRGPHSAVGLTDADAVALADAVADIALREGASCALTDAALDDARLCEADLVAAIRAAWQDGAAPA